MVDWVVDVVEHNNEVARSVGFRKNKSSVWKKTEKQGLDFNPVDFGCAQRNNDNVASDRV